VPGRPSVRVKRLALGAAPAGRRSSRVPTPSSGDGSKSRIALCCANGDIDHTSPALALADAIESAPSGWRTALAALDQEAADAGLDLRVYGSLAFQALTGQAYVTASSDIDLLLHPAAAPDYRHALDLLTRHARVLPLDGEIVFGGGRAVAWKELAAAQHGQARVLAKSLQGIALVTVDSLLISLRENVPCSA
jgi:phosphoribosyl-dephospho-CoA transferase